MPSRIPLADARGSEVPILSRDREGAVIGSSVRLVYLGTPAFAVPTLERVVEAGHRVLEVVTQPDRPKGRGGQPAASPVKQAALRLNLPLYQPERIRRPEAVAHLAALSPDVMVIVGYGQIIPQSVIDLAPRGIVNVHASLLPAYRGAAPIQWAVANGETVTGVTTMRIDAGLDTGDILLAEATEIGPEETAVELSARLAVMGADLLVRTLDGIAAGTVEPRPQDHTRATLAPILKKEDGLIDWTLPAAAIHNRVRGFQPWPGAWTRFRGRTLHVWKSRLSPDAPEVPPGRLLRRRALWGGCRGAALELVEVQLEGRRRMSAADFANGLRLPENELITL